MKKSTFSNSIVAGMSPRLLPLDPEYPIGEAVTMNEMECRAVYLKPIDMGTTCMSYYLLRNQISTFRSRYPRKGNLKKWLCDGEWMPYQSSDDNFSKC